LRRLREDAGLHLDRMADQLRCSPSRLSRIETARIRIAPGTVHEILDVLDIHDERRERLVALAHQAEEPGWWQEYTDVLPYEYATYIALESEAVAIRSFEPLVVPGLLQTPDYARAVITKATLHHRPDEAEPLVRARVARQAVLTRPDPLRFWVLIAEEALHRMVGGRTVMRAQLERLIKLEMLPHVCVQVLPLEQGAHAAMTGAFSILELPDPDDPEVVYVESVVGDIYVENPHGVDLCTRIFATLAADALDADNSMGLVRNLVRSMA
jgi:transcriptional regulator with XRE-family HTH domain